MQIFENKRLSPVHALDNQPPKQIETSPIGGA
jgi:hypothetical protein